MLVYMLLDFLFTYTLEKFDLLFIWYRKTNGLRPFFWPCVNIFLVINYYNDSYAIWVTIATVKHGYIKHAYK